MKTWKPFYLAALLAIAGIVFTACPQPCECESPTGPNRENVLPYIPAESGLRGSTWTSADTSSTIIFSTDGYNVSSDPNTFTIISYGKRPDGAHMIVTSSSASSYWIINGNTLTAGSNTYTRQ